MARRSLPHRRVAWVRRLTLSLLMLDTLLLMGGAQAQAAPSGWGRYRDRELAMSFDFPSQVFSIKSAAQGREGGVTFSTPDGRARIRVFAPSNSAHDTPAGYLGRIRKAGEGRFTYVRTTRRFFVASGLHDGMIFYRRCNFSTRADARISCLQMDYPQGEKRAWDRIVTRISLSLRTAAE